MMLLMYFLILIYMIQLAISYTTALHNACSIVSCYHVSGSSNSGKAEWRATSSGAKRGARS